MSTQEENCKGCGDALRHVHAAGLAPGGRPWMLCLECAIDLKYNPPEMFSVIEERMGLVH